MSAQTHINPNRMTLRELRAIVAIHSGRVVVWPRWACGGAIYELRGRGFISRIAQHDDGSVDRLLVGIWCENVRAQDALSNPSAT